MDQLTGLVAVDQLTEVVPTVKPVSWLRANSLGWWWWITWYGQLTGLVLVDQRTGLVAVHLWLC